MKRVILVIDVNDELPAEPGAYYVELELPNNGVSIRKIFFNGTEFKVNGGKRKIATVRAWYKTTYVDDGIYNEIKEYVYDY